MIFNVLDVKVKPLPHREYKVGMLLKNKHHGQVMRITRIIRKFDIHYIRSIHAKRKDKSYYFQGWMIEDNFMVLEGMARTLYG